MHGWASFFPSFLTRSASNRLLVERNMGVNDSAREDSEECEGKPGKHMLSVLENT